MFLLGSLITIISLFLIFYPDTISEIFVITNNHFPIPLYGLISLSIGALLMGYYSF